MLILQTGMHLKLAICTTSTHRYDRWMFEKYDGVRGFWNPLKRAFYSRSGVKFDHFPREIVDSMPDDIFLDGELWYLPPLFEFVGLSTDGNGMVLKVW